MRRGLGDGSAEWVGGGPRKWAQVETRARVVRWPRWGQVGLGGARVGMGARVSVSEVSLNWVCSAHKHANQWQYTIICTVTLMSIIVP